MAGVLMPVPRLQVANGSGSPYAGAKLYFYEAGTSTPLDTYTTQALSVAHANPVVADADGRFAGIYLSSRAYKVVLKTSADVQIWSEDNVQLAQGAANLNAVTVAADYTALTTDDLLLASGTLTVTLPTAVGNTGKQFTIKNISTGVVTLDGNGAQTIDGLTTWKLGGANTWVQIVSDGSNWRVIGRGGHNSVSKTATYTATLDDDTILATSGTFTITLPTAVGNKGKRFLIKNLGSGTVTVDGNGAETIDGSATFDLVQYDALSLESDGSNWSIF